MKPELEKYLWDHLPYCNDNEYIFAGDIINDMVNKGMIKSPKEAYPTLEKWAAQGKYEYGTSSEGGCKLPDKTKLNTALNKRNSIIFSTTN